MDKALSTIRTHWQSLGVSIEEGLSEKEILEFENRNGIRMPDEMRNFYRLMDGMNQGEADDDWISFWPLSQVSTIPEKLSHFRGIPDYGEIEAILPEAAKYFVFADHSIWLHVYAVKLSKLSETSEVVWICGKHFKPIAASFGDFLNQYASSPKSIAYPPFP